MAKIPGPKFATGSIVWIPETLTFGYDNPSPDSRHPKPGTYLVQNVRKSVVASNLVYDFVRCTPQGKPTAKVSHCWDVSLLDGVAKGVPVDPEEEDPDTLS